MWTVPHIWQDGPNKREKTRWAGATRFLFICIGWNGKEISSFNSKLVSDKEKITTNTREISRLMNQIKLFETILNDKCCVFLLAIVAQQIVLLKNSWCVLFFSLDNQLYLEIDIEM